jgi:hypothetical protein
MRLRRMPSAVAASVVALAALQTGIAAASPSLEMAPAKRAGPQCSTQVAGVDASRHVVLREIQNRELLADKRTAGALPFDPTALGFHGYKDTTTGYKEGFTAIVPGQSPRLINVRQLDGRSRLTFTTEKMRMRSFSPRLLATSGGYYNFTVTPPGVLKRWTLFVSRSGQRYYGSPRRVLRGVDHLATLAYAFRKKVDGIESDYLYATTDSGGLVQLRVPVDRPSQARKTTVKQHHFKGTTDLSLSYCDTPSTLSLIAVNATDGEARWFTLSDQFHPRATNLVDRGLILRQADWALHAVI